MIDMTLKYIPMKTIKLICLFFPLVSSFIAYSQDSKEEQKSAKAAEISNLVETKHFVFRPQSATASRGATQQLSYGYSLAVSPDEVVSDLPYFGRAYSAPINPSDGGIKFKSTEFDYTVKNRKKGGWDITLVPKDVNNAPKVYLSVAANGNTSLRVISTNRESISFSGFIEAKKQD